MVGAKFATPKSAFLQHQKPPSECFFTTPNCAVPSGPPGVAKFATLGVGVVYLE